jgi:prophage regulatory protein
MQPTISLLRLDAVKARTGLGRSVIYKLASEGRFPAPIHPENTRLSCWDSSAIDRWVAQQLAREVAP